MKRILLIAIATLIAIGQLVPTATADVNGTGLFQGLAEVGRHFRNQDNTEDRDCTKDAKDVYARGQGLYMAPPIGPSPKNGVWSLHTTFLATGTNTDGALGVITGTLDLCGFLTHTLLGQGPACDISKGHSGLGQANFDGGGGLNLFDVQWKTSAYGYKVVTGKYQVWNGTKETGKDKKNKWGNIIAMVNAQGGQRCLESKSCPDQKTASQNTQGCGAQAFTVFGTFDLIQPGDANRDGDPNKKDDVFRPKDNPDGDDDYQDGTLCKDDGGDFGPCLFDPKKGNGKETPKPKPEG